MTPPPIILKNEWGYLNTVNVLCLILLLSLKEELLTNPQWHSQDFHIGGARGGQAKTVNQRWLMTRRTKFFVLTKARFARVLGI